MGDEHGKNELGGALRRRPLHLNIAEYFLSLMIPTLPPVLGNRLGAWVTHNTTMTKLQDRAERV